VFAGRMSGGELSAGSRGKLLPMKIQILETKQKKKKKARDWEGKVGGAREYSNRPVAGDLKGIKLFGQSRGPIVGKTSTLEKMRKYNRGDLGTRREEGRGVTVRTWGFVIKAFEGNRGEDTPY